MSKKYTADDIKVLSDREHVRLRTSIYLGSTEETEFVVPIFKDDKIEIKHKSFIPALYKSLNEIIDNAIDELTQLKKKDKRIYIKYNYDEDLFKVCDNGRGVPIDLHPQTNRYTPETVFTELRSGRNFKDDEKDSGVIGTNGVGSSCVAMISEEFNVEIKRDKKIYQQTYRNGTEIIEEPFLNHYSGKDTGTCIEFKFDKSLKQFKTIKLDDELVQNRACEVALNNNDIKVEFELIKDNENFKKEYFFKNGFKDYISKITDKYFEFKINEDDFVAKYYILTDLYSGIDEKIFVYVNSSLLFEGGTAVNFFFNSFFNNVVNVLKKETKKRKIELNKNDVRQNLLVIGFVKMKNPRYDNQSKTRLISQEIKKYIEKMVEKDINNFIKQNPEWVEEVMDRALFRQRIADMEEVKKRQKKKKGKPVKLVDAYSKRRELCSIAFAEGDCVDENVFVKTKDGIVKLKDVEVGCEVLTHKGRYKKVIVKKETYKKPIVIKFGEYELRVSEDHKMIVYSRKEDKIVEIKAKDLINNFDNYMLLRRKND
jgi:DNA gyrase subunit B